MSLIKKNPEQLSASNALELAKLLFEASDRAIEVLERSPDAAKLTVVLNAMAAQKVIEQGVTATPPPEAPILLAQPHEAVATLADYSQTQSRNPLDITALSAAARDNAVSANATHLYEDAN